MMKSITRRLSENDYLLSVVLMFIVSAIAYLTAIKGLGIYRDDWHLLWAAQAKGIDYFTTLFSIDRPLLGVIHTQIFRLFGENFLAWNFFVYAVQLIAAVGFLWILRMLWPEQRLSTTVMALLFVIYPGYLQWANPITYWTEILNMALAIFSVAFTLQGYRTRNLFARIIFISLSVVLAVSYLFIVEYMVGLEGFRLLLMWYQESKDKKQRSLTTRAGHVLIKALPYLVITAIFLVWRLLIYKSSRPTTNMSFLVQKYLLLPVHQAGFVLIEWFKDFFEIIVGAWVIPVYTSSSVLDFRVLAVSFLLGGLAIGITLLYFLWAAKKGTALSFFGEDTSYIFPEHALWLGALTVLVVSLPVILANRHVILNAPGLGLDRYSLPPSLGAAMVVGGLLAYGKDRRRWLSLFFALLLVGAAVVTHYNNAIQFSNAWTEARDYWWQMTWRAPQIKSDTLLIADTPGAYVLEGYQVAYPANLIYFPDSDSVEISSEILNDETTSKIIMGVFDDRKARTVYFPMNFANTLVTFTSSSGGCVHVVDGSKVVLPDATDSRIQVIAPYSKIDRIDTSAPPHSPPVAIFGAEPAHGWCYFYQRASLAAQIGNWDEVVQLGTEAKQLGFHPSDRTEWLPFLEAYVHLGDYDTAKQLTAIKGAEPAYFRYQMCNVLNSPGSSGDWNQDQQVFLDSLFCGK